MINRNIVIVQCFKLTTIALVLVACGAPQPTATSIPPTDTPAPTANTPVPPTDTLVPPTETLVPPTETLVPLPPGWSQMADMPTARWSDSSLDTNVIDGHC
jgi:hypothetical protein